jgi:hypothetical protein
MTRTIRCSIAIALGVLTLGLAAAPAAASQNVAFSIHKGNAANANVWHGEATGNVTFFGTGRKVRVQGTASYHHSPTNPGTGYTQVRQNLTNTTSDPAWQSVTEGTCTVDSTPPGTTYNCSINRLFQPPALPNRKLAGVWLRICTSVKGPDPDTCGPVQYRDNPLQG